MDENSINLIIEINYKNEKFKIERKEEISYNELMESSIKYFNIEVKNGDNIIFIYTDEDNEKNILEHNDEDIFSSANYIDDNYRLNLDLIIVDSQRSNIENKINENKKEVNNNDSNIYININDNKNYILEDKGEENKGIKRSNNEIENKLIHIDFLVKKQFNKIQKDISKMINNKYKEIENELKKFNIQASNINNNAIIPRSNINENKSNKRNESQVNNLGKSEKDNEMMLGRCSTFSYYKKEDNAFEIINSINFDDNNINSDHSEDDDFDNKIGKNNQEKKINKVFKKIRKNINDLFKKNFSYNDIVNKGNNIYEIMNDNKKIIKIEINDINKEIKHYLTKGHKKFLSLKEKIKYCNILGYLNHFLEIKKIHKSLDDNLQKEIEDQISKENGKEKNKQNEKEKEKNKQKTEKENINENKIVLSSIDSFDKNWNKAYVQTKLQYIINELNKEEVNKEEFNKSKIESIN